MSGTHVFYNGVLMRDCELLEFNQTIEKDKSQTDVLYSKFMLTVRSTLSSLVGDGEYAVPLADAHLSTIAVPSISGGGITISDRIQEIERRLQEHRKDFWFAVNAQTYKSLADNLPSANAPSNTPDNADSYRVVLAAVGLVSQTNLETGEDEAAPLDGNLEAFVSGETTEIPRKDVVDTNNGPKPISSRVERIDGGRIMRVTLTIEVCRCVCDDDDDRYSLPPARDAARVEGVISNKWSITESLDENWATTMSVQGTLVVSDQRYKLTSMRLMTATALFPYAKMKDRKFITSEDGLTLGYSYTLHEVGGAPPPHIVSWDGTYSETTKVGGLGVGHIEARVTGSVSPPNGFTTQEYKQYMIRILFLIIQSRINVSGLPEFNVVPGQNPKTVLVKETAIVEKMHSPEIMMRCTVQYSDIEVGKQFMSRYHNMGLPLQINQYDEKWWPIPPAFPWNVEQMNGPNKSWMGSQFAGYYQSPCGSWHGKPRGLSVEDNIEERKDQSGSSDTTFVAYIGEWRGNNTIPYSSPPANFPATGYAESQLSGFSYLAVDIDNSYDSDEGVMCLPLSKARSGTSMICIPVHAGGQFRELRMVATRQGDWPKVPKPLPKIVRGTIVETLIKKKVVTDIPKLQKDGATLEYTTHIKWIYALSRIVGTYTGTGDGDYYVGASSPIDKTTPVNNQLAVSKFYDETGLIDTTLPPA